MGSFVGLDPWQTHPPDEHRALAKTSLTLGLYQGDSRGSGSQIPQWYSAVQYSLTFRSVSGAWSSCCVSSPFGALGMRKTTLLCQEHRGGGRRGSRWQGWGAELAGRDPKSEHASAMPSLNSRGQQESCSLEIGL